MEKVNQLRLNKFTRDGLIVLLLTLGWFLLDQRNQRNIWYTFFLLVFAVSFLILLVFLIKKPVIPTKMCSKTTGKGSLTLPGFTVLLLVVLFFTLPLGPLASGSARLVILVAWSLLCGFLLAWQNRDRNPYLIFATMLILGGVLYRTAAFANEISPSPFALGWSEGSRIYNASLFFSQKLYGQKLPLPVLHPSRYLMQSVPFLFGIRDILLHRVWQVLLWLAMTGWAAWLIAKKLASKLPFPLFWISAFLFLFFFQGAVYYHLMVCVILVLLGYKNDKPWRTLLFVLLASLWAGISRINWIPVPALLAVSLYLLDEPLQGRKLLDYLKWPVLWSVLGLLAAYGSKQLYQSISGENPALFDSAFSSQLLWSRLFPNATFPLGILPAIALVCLPLLFLTWLHVRKHLPGKVHCIRWLGLVGILGVFFAGGVLVSLKIGGGGDLHNLDAFLVFFALICLGILGGRLKTEPTQPANPVFSLETLPSILILLVSLIPVWFAFMRSGLWSFTPPFDDQSKLIQIQQAIDLVNQEPGPILFVTERQLLTMGQIQGVALEPDYEKVFLMEMAMGNNHVYLQEFYRLLDEHHFKAILMEPISTNIQASWKSFAEENNSYVRNVILPMLMDYQLALSWDEGEINLLIPNGEAQLLESLRELQK